MIQSLAACSNLIVCLENMRSNVKVLQLCIFEFIKLGIHVPTKLVTSISWLPLDRIDLKLELRLTLHIRL